MLIGEYINRLAELVPERAWRSTVVIVRAQRPEVIQLGTGTLFSIADRSFVITAGHVIRAGLGTGQTLGIGGGERNFITLTEPIICSTHPNSSDQDLFDIAIVPLNDVQAKSLQSNIFLRFDDVSFEALKEANWMTIFGFPHCWATRSTEEDQDMRLKPFQFTTTEYRGATTNLSGYSDRLHLLLSLDSNHLYDSQGKSIDSYPREEQSKVFPTRLNGISGCSVWTIEVFQRPLGPWKSGEAKLIAVQTGVYPKSGIIASTRWAAVATLFYRSFPELRSAIGLYRQG